MPKQKRTRGHPKRHLRLWLLLFIVWIIAFAVIFNALGLKESGDALAHIKIEWLAAAVLAFLAAQLVSIMNWHILTRFLSIRIGLRKLSQIHFAGLFVDHILPNLAPGGELTMTYLLHRQAKVPFSKAMASVMMQAIGWFISFIAFTAVLIGITLWQGVLDIGMAIVLSVLLVVFSLLLLLIVYMAFSPKSCERLVDHIVCGLSHIICSITRKPEHKERLVCWVNRTIESFYLTFHHFMESKMIVVGSCVVLLLNHLLLATSFLFVLRSLGIIIPVPVAFLIFMSVSLFSMLTFIPGQFVAYEGLCIALLTPEAGVLAATLATTITRLIHYWAVVFSGGFFALKLGIESVNLRDLGEE